MRHRVPAAEGGGRQLHRRAPPHDRGQRRDGGQAVAPGPRAGPDRLGQLVFLLMNRRDQPASPGGREPQAPHPGRPHPQHRDARAQHRRSQHQPACRRQDAGYHEQAHGSDPDAGDAAQQQHPAVEPDPAGHDRGQPEQCREVEHIRADHDPRADAGLAAGQRGHRGGDLRRISGQRRDQPQPGLGEPGPLGEPLQPGDQQPARGQAHRHPGGERQQPPARSHYRPRPVPGPAPRQPKVAAWHVT